MQAYVFTDKSLERFAGQFVWLAIDTEKAKNAAFLKRFPVAGVPTFYVMDPRSEKVALRWLGSFTAPQMAKIFEDGRRSFSRPATSAKKKRTLLDDLAQADSFYGEGKNEEAAKAYGAILKRAPADWSSRPRVTESYLFALMSSGQTTTCAETAYAAFPRLRDTPSALTLTAIGLECALNMTAENEKQADLATALEILARQTMDNPKVEVAADDRSGLYIVLITAREKAKDEAGERRVTEEWASFLEREAEKASNTEARAVFDSHRLSAYMELGQPERAIPMLEASERELPDDYNPPARLAVAYRAMKEYDKALAASDRALEKIYGPRKLGVLTTRADIYLDLKKTDEAKTTLQEAIALAEGLPEGQRSERRIESLKKKLESIQ